MLQILGRGAHFDAVAEQTLISEGTAIASFHTFCARFSEKLFGVHIALPTGPAKTKAMEEFHRAGFTGAIGFTDVIRIKWDGCPHTEQRGFVGKEGHATIAYEATVDRSGRCCHVTRGFRGAQNDKTMIRFDRGVQRVRESPEYTMQAYELKRADGASVIVRGNYLLVESGYHKVRDIQ